MFAFESTPTQDIGYFTSARIVGPPLLLPCSPNRKTAVLVDVAAVRVGQLSLEGCGLKVVPYWLWGLLAAVALSCSSPEAQPTPKPSPASAAETTGVTIAVASTDLAVGPNRFVFGVITGQGAVRVPEAAVAFVYLDETPSVVASTANAMFTKWPAGPGGVYVTEASFDRAGRWGAIVQVQLESGDKTGGQAGFEVHQNSSAPEIGQPAPKGTNKTADDVNDLKDLTTSPVPDPDLYRLTIDQATLSGMPTVVTFATPAFCSTATCGPQVLVVSSVKNRYKDEANFIHVEVYDNSAEMGGDLSKGRLSPLMEVWGLLSEPFTFVLDQEGRVASKFQGFVTEAELEDSLRRVLGP